MSFPVKIFYRQDVNKNTYKVDISINNVNKHKIGWQTKVVVKMLMIIFVASRK